MYVNPAKHHPWVGKCTNGLCVRELTKWFQKNDFFFICLGNSTAIDAIQLMDLTQSYSEKKAEEAYQQHFLQPIHEHANEKIIELLVNNGADVNYKAKDDKTPYIVASGLDNERIKNLLLKHDAKTE